MRRNFLNLLIFVCCFGAAADLLAEEANPIESAAAAEGLIESVPVVNELVEPESGTGSVLGVLEEIVSPARKVDSLIEEKLKVLGVETLEDFIELHMRLEERRNQAEYDLRRSVSETEQARLRVQIAALEEQIIANESRFEEIATGVNLSVSNENTENLNFTQNLKLLVDPLFKALLQSTEGIRIKADIVEDISNYELTLAQADRAVENLEAWLERDINEESRARLTELLARWENQQLEMSSNLKASQLQLQQHEAEKLSIGDKFGLSLKNFFQNRGLYCALGLMSFFVVLLICNLLYRVIMRLPVFTDGTRSFNARLFDLVYKATSMILAALAPLITFYVFEDWVMFSIGLLVAFGVLWSLRNVIPKMWRQGRLLLNIGAVREGERINYFGLPWRIRRLNIFSELENPDNKLRLRVPIEELLGLTSKPIQRSESWFPCKKGDWVILSDGYRGEVTAISIEFVDIDDRGLSTKSYPMQEFLALRPLNISGSFRLKEMLGISYNHKSDSTNKILGSLKRFIKQKIADEGYEPHVKNLQVEFGAMGDSSLDIAVIMDIEGSQAPAYNRIKRAMQRWCVDATSKYAWEIPYPQRTLHMVQAAQSQNHVQTDMFAEEDEVDLESEAAE